MIAFFVVTLGPPNRLQPAWLKDQTRLKELLAYVERETGDPDWWRMSRGAYRREWALWGLMLLLWWLLAWPPYVLTGPALAAVILISERRNLGR